MDSSFLAPKSGFLRKASGSFSPPQKEATIVAVKSSHLEVDLATKDGIKVISWYSICKAFSIGDFVNVTSLRGITVKSFDAGLTLRLKLIVSDS